MPTGCTSNLDQGFERLGAFWSPAVIASANRQNVKVAEACWVVLVEPATTKHTGDTDHELTRSSAERLAHVRAPSQATRLQETEAQWPSKS